MNERNKDQAVNFHLPEYDEELDTLIQQQPDELEEDGEVLSVLDTQVVQDRIVKIIQKKILQRSSIEENIAKRKIVNKTLNDVFKNKLLDEKSKQPLKYTKLSQKVFDQYVPSNQIVNTVYVGIGGMTLYFGYMDQVNKIPLNSPNRVNGFSRFVKVLQITPTKRHEPQTFLHRAGWVNTLNRGFIKFSQFKNSDTLQIKSNQVLNKKMFFNPKYTIAYVKYYIKNHILQKHIHQTRMYHQHLFMNDSDISPTLQKSEIDGEKLKLIAEQSLQLLKDAQRNYETLQQFFKERIDK